MITSMTELKAHAKRVGNKWFTPSTMAFFNSRTHGRIIPLSQVIGADRGLFVSSEKFEDEPRRFTVRIFVAGDYSLSIDDVYGFQAYETEAEARAAAVEFAKG